MQQEEPCTIDDADKYDANGPDRNTTWLYVQQIHTATTDEHHKADQSVRYAITRVP